MPNGKISKAVVDDAQKGEKDYFIWDKKISGFGLKVTAVWRQDLCPSIPHCRTR